MRKIIDSGIRGFLILLMGLLVINVVWQVFSRYILNAPSTFTDELARFLLIWVSLLGVAYLSGQNQHISIDLVPQKIKPVIRRRLSIFINLVIIIFASAVLILGGGMLVYYTYTYTQLTPILQIPMAYIYLIAPLTGLLVVYYKLNNIKRIIKSDEPGSETDYAADEQRLTPD